MTTHTKNVEIRGEKFSRRSTRFARADETWPIMMEYEQTSDRTHLYLDVSNRDRTKLADAAAEQADQRAFAKVLVDLAAKLGVHGSTTRHEYGYSVAMLTPTQPQSAIHDLMKAEGFKRGRTDGSSFRQTRYTRGELAIYSQQDHVGAVDRLSAERIRVGRGASTSSDNTSESAAVNGGVPEAFTFNHGSDRRSYSRVVYVGKDKKGHLICTAMQPNGFYSTIALMPNGKQIIAESFANHTIDMAVKMAKVARAKPKLEVNFFGGMGKLDTWFQYKELPTITAVGQKPQADVRTTRIDREIADVESKIKKDDFLLDTNELKAQLRRLKAERKSYKSLSKTGDWWQKATVEEQQAYLKQHPGSKLKLTAKNKAKITPAAKADPDEPLHKGALADYARSKDDPEVTAAKIYSKLDPADVEEMKAKVAEATSLPGTDSTYMKDGEYTAERKKMHNEIIKSILSPEAIKAAKPPAGTKPTFVVLGGRGGSGKSAFTHGHGGEKPAVDEFDSRKFLVMDADEIKGKLKPPYEGWNANQVHEESSYLFEKIVDTAKKMGLNIVSDATLKSDKMGPQLEDMQKNGYDIEGHYMFLPRQKAAERACGRYLSKGPDKRGRLVPPEVILGNTKNEENFDKLKGYFKKWSAYDNDQPKGTPPKLINRGAAKE